MQDMEGNVAVFEASTGEIVGAVAYGLENGYLEIVECLIETEFTEEIVMKLLELEEVEDKSQFYFYETQFVDKNILKEMGTEWECREKEAIMVKVLTEEKSYQQIWNDFKVYLNELV